MVRERVLALLEAAKRRITCMSETSIREEFEAKGNMQLRSFWSPSVYTMTIERYELDEEATREEESSREGTQSVEEGRACTHTL